MFKHIFTHWKTSLYGIGGAALTQAAAGTNWKTIGVSALFAILGMIAKDPGTVDAPISTALKSFILVGALCLLPASSQAQQKPVHKHAVPKLFRVAVAPVVHPKRTVKQIAGSILFTAESGVDVAHFTLDALNKVVADEFKPYEPLTYLDKGAAKLDTGLENTEDRLFGFHN